MLGGSALVAAGGIFVFGAPVVSARLAAESVRPGGLSLTLLADPTRSFLEQVFTSSVMNVLVVLVTLFLFFLVRLLIRKEWIAASMVALVLSASALVEPVNPVVSTLLVFLGWGAVMLALLRFGLVGNLAGWLTVSVLQVLPMAPSLSAWYARTEVVGLLLVLAIAVAMFVISLGGRPVFGKMGLEE
jgi:hypothetical protein